MSPSTCREIERGGNRKKDSVLHIQIELLARGKGESREGKAKARGGKGGTYDVICEEEGRGYITGGDTQGLNVGKT